MTREQASYRGSCHCGAVTFEITSDFPELTTCNCSICTKKNALMVRVHEDDFKQVSGELELSEYNFHTGTARHFFCSKCGVYTFHRKRMMPDSYGVNVFCLEGFDPAGIPVRETNGIELT